VDPVVAEDREQEREAADEEVPEDVQFDAGGLDQDLRTQHLVEHVEPDEAEHDDDADDRDASIAELRTRLDHLRQTELRPLSGVECGEHRAHGRAEQNRERGGEERRAESGAEHSRGQGRDVRVRHEPKREEAPRVPGPFV